MHPVRNQFRPLLLTLAACQLAAGIGVVAWLGFLKPLDATLGLDATQAGAAWTAVASTSPTTPAAEGDDLERLLSKPLRRAAGGGGPSVSAAVVPPAAPPATFPPLALVGTIGNSLALLRTPAGTVQAKAAGEAIAGATVRAITRDRVEFEWNGQRVTVARAVAPATAPAARPADSE